jgi:MoaA/NifB/PqqE/SkfB family radical SAM enzyme
MTKPFQMPRVLAWEVTRRCPLNCRHCRAAAANIAYENELSTAECLRVIDSLDRTMIIWTGGEPMLRPDIIELVRQATDKGLRSVMAPCGMLVTEDRLRALKDAGVMACSFSLDGPDAATHDAFRGVDGAYANVTRAMSVARGIGMPFQVNTTVSTLNIGQLVDSTTNGKRDVYLLSHTGNHLCEGLTTFERSCDIKED